MRFRAKSLTSLLFAFLLALPMISVISKVIYVQSNKNAFESYYGKTINEEYKTTYNFNELQIGKNYYLTNQNNSGSEITGTAYIAVADVTINNVQYTTTARLRFQQNANGGYIALYESTGNDWITAFDLTNTSYTFNFTYLGLITQNSTLWDTFDGLYYTLTYNDYSYLDNVFEYAVDEVIKDNNFGNIDFFSYFTSIFMSDNQVNNRYIGYVNYYLNYALMVSLAYLLFLMLMWFINFARRFLDRGMNYDW